MVACGSSERSLRRRTAGCISQLGSGGCAGQKSGPVSRRIRTAPLQWWPRFSGRRPLAASARVGPDYSDAVARPTPSRRHGGQMRPAADAAGGSTLLPTAYQQPLGAPPARRTTSRPTTDVLSRDAEWVRATRARMRRPSVRIAGGPMGRGLTPALPPVRQEVEVTTPTTQGRGGRGVSRG